MWDGTPGGRSWKPHDASTFGVCCHRGSHPLNLDKTNHGNGNWTCIEWKTCLSPTNKSGLTLGPRRKILQNWAILILLFDNKILLWVQIQGMKNWSHVSVASLSLPNLGDEEKTLSIKETKKVIYLSISLPPLLSLQAPTSSSRKNGGEFHVFCQTYTQTWLEHHHCLSL